MASKVYFTDFCTGNRESLPQKLARLIMTAGFDQIDFENKYAAIKIHFGEKGNLAFLRPNYAKVVVDLIKDLGGKPFLTDANTMYVGSRKNALDHLDTAYENGFSPFSTGCHVIIADGLKGTDDVAVPVEGAEYCKEAYIGRAVMDADIIISLNHFKGHEEAGFGGAIKNLGMGCGSNEGKRDMHSNGRPSVDPEKCVACGQCAKNCAHGAISFDDGKANINHDICVGCGRCIGACPMDAVVASWDESRAVLNCKIAEYTKAVVDGRPAFHINIVADVSPNCDCEDCNDLPIIPDVGMFASFDPIALDQACVDAVNAQEVNKGSILDEIARDAGLEAPRGDHFKMIHPDTCWQAGLEHGEKLGLGTREYELVKI